MAFFIPILALMVVGGFIYVYVVRSRYLLRKWARDHGYELLHADFRMLRKGRYMWSSRGQAVFRVEVRDREGRTRQGWVRCGGWWTGVWGEHVESKLEE